MYREIGPKTRSRRRVCVCVFEAKLQSFWGRGASVCFRVVCSFLGKKPPTQTIDVWEWKRKYSCPPSGLVAEGKLSAPADCPLLDRGVSASPVKVWSSVTLFLGLVVGGSLSGVLLLWEILPSIVRLLRFASAAKMFTGGVPSNRCTSNICSIRWVRSVYEPRKLRFLWRCCLPRTDSSNSHHPGRR